jgi:hypothetical protein
VRRHGEKSGEHIHHDGGQKQKSQNHDYFWVHQKTEVTFWIPGRKRSFQEVTSGMAHVWQSMWGKEHTGKKSSDAFTLQAKCRLGQKAVIAGLPGHWASWESFHEFSLSAKENMVHLYVIAFSVGSAWDLPV